MLDYEGKFVTPDIHKGKIRGNKVRISIKKRKSYFLPPQSLLPDGYEYKVCEYSKSEANIHAVLRLKVTTEDSARAWINEFQEKTKTTLRIMSKHKATGQKNVFNIHLRCHHNTVPRTHTADFKNGSKNTNCPATMTVIVKRVITHRKGKYSTLLCSTVWFMCIENKAFFIYCMLSPIDHL